MPISRFDESVSAEKLPLEALRWMSDAASYVRHTPNSGEEVFGDLKLLLRLLAVRNPESQSHATRKTLGLLVEALYEQPNSEKLCGDLLDLFVRIIDAKQGYRYSPMKHLAISGLGHLAVHLSSHIRQMSANVFVIGVESFKIAPVMPQTLWYRNTILWTLTQASSSTVDEKSLSSAVSIAKNCIENSGKYGPESVARAFSLLTALVPLPNARFLAKHTSSITQIYQDYGLLAVNESVAEAAAKFYAVFLVNHGSQGVKAEIVKAINSYEKHYTNKKPSKRTHLRVSGYEKLLYHLVSMLDPQSSGFQADLEEIYIPNLLLLPHKLAKALIVDLLVSEKLGTDHAGVDTLGVLIRQLALAQAPPVSKKTKDLNLKPLMESVLACLGSLVKLLGNAVQPVAEMVHQATISLIVNGKQNPTDEQLALIIKCLLELCASAPALIGITASICLKQFELEATSERKRVLAYVISAMISESSRFPLYGDVELNTRVLLLGVNLLRSSDVLEYRSGWTFILGVLCLGPQVIKPMVPQLLGLWESHLQVQVSPEHTEAALAGMVVFISKNRVLLTPDVTLRISKVLNSLWSLVESSPNPYVRRRLLECYKLVLDIGKQTDYPSSLLLKYIAHSTSPGSYSKTTGVHVDSAISGIKSGEKNEKGSGGDEKALDAKGMTEYGMASIPNDPRRSLNNDLDAVIFLNCAEPNDVSTAVVDLAIDTTAKLLPMQPERIKESVFDAVLTNLENSISGKSFRCRAVTYNVAKLLLATLESSAIFSQRVLTVILSLVKRLLNVKNTDVRPYALRSCGVLARALRIDTSGSPILASIVKDLLDVAVSENADYYTRGSHVLALGYISEQWPNLALLEAMFKVLMPMAAHPHEEVHIPALESMRRTLTSSEMVDQKYVKCTLKTVGLTMLLDSHNNNAVFRREVAESLALIVARIGPMLSTEPNKQNRAIILCLADQLQNSSEPGVRALAWKSFIELYYYSRQGITWSLLVRRWKNIVVGCKSSEEEVDAAVNGLLMLMKLSASSLFAATKPNMDDALWLLLDRYPRHPTILAIFHSWVDQTSKTDVEITHWISRLMAVVMKPRYIFVNRVNAVTRNEDSVEAIKQASVTPTAVAADEDVTLDVKSDERQNDQFSWEARAFAIELLLRVLKTDVGDTEVRERSRCVCTSKVGDIIKIAFSSATSQISGLQFAGLRLLNEVILQFGELDDPDFPNISLLEQYQVQIISALSPAFRRDSTPGVALAALHTSSTFLKSPVIKSKEKLQKLTRVLEASVHTIDGDFALGEVELTSNARRVFIVSVLAVWAEVENHTAGREHLQEIIGPLRPKLIQFWAKTLVDYGVLKSVVESQWAVTSMEDLVVQMKDTQVSCIMQAAYRATWVSIARALALPQNLSEVDISPLVLCGLCFQSLLETLQHNTNHIDEVSVIEQPTIREHRLAVLQTLEIVLTPETSTLAISSANSYFEEIVQILYRVMVTGTPEEQQCVLSIARSLVAGQPETDDSVDHFFEVLKIAMQPLRSLMPQVFVTQTSVSTNPTVDQTALLQHTMDTLIDITQVFREVIQNDLWLCLLRIFEQLNHFAPAVAAPSFKKLLEILAAQAEQRGITFIIGALTASLRKAVENNSTTEALLVCSALTCTNSKVLLSPESLTEVQRFGERAGDALKKVLVPTNESESSESESDSKKEAGVALQCILAVIKVCGGTPSGGAFAYGCLPGLIRTSKAGDDLKEFRTQALKALVLYAELDGSLESLSLVLPVLVSCSQYNQVNSLVLDLASKQPSLFKETVWRMDPADRNVLQDILAQQVSDENSEESEVSEDDSGIELTSFI